MAGDRLIKLRDMRSGVPTRKLVNLGNGDNSVEIAVVVVSADVMLSINEEVEEKYRDTPDTKHSGLMRNQYYNMLLCYYCMRDPDKLDELMFDNKDEVGETLNLEDIKRVMEAYNELIINCAPKLETMNEEDFDEIKKFLGGVQLKDLSTVSLVHLMYFLQTIRSEN